uniref:Uncharacterized protein n=1 Tax=Romanomermis culicivorax TaxID=13658 RepID=A0A915LAA7_ROMCU
MNQTTENQPKSEKFGSCKEIREMPYCVIENHGFFALKTPCHDEKAGAPCVVEVAEAKDGMTQLRPSHFV